MKEFVKTAMPIVLGIIAGILSYFITLGSHKRDPFGIVILVFLIYIQKFLLKKFGIVPEPKDWIGYAFFTFSSWYITWTFMLNL